jgi:dCTP deaminase
MILSAREISARLAESGCIPAGSQDPGDGDPENKKSHDPSAGPMKKSKDGRSLIISPFSMDCLQPASYDLRVAQDMVLMKGTCTLVPSLEWVEIAGDLAATLRCRSSFGRKGVLISAGFIDPGFRGQLTLCLVNMGQDDIVLHRNDRVVQMILHEVREGDRLYNGRYQDSHGAIDSR